MGVQAVQITVKGRVQGVGFRYYTLEAAEENGVVGWVRNAADGTLQVLAQGEAGNLERFLERVRSGPRMSHVDDVDVLPAEPRDDLATFRVRY